jgi:hypothetical protein
MKYWYKNENVAVITKKDRKELLDDFDNTNTIGHDPITHVFGGSCLRTAYYARKKTGCNDKPLQAQREILLEFDNGLMLGVCNQKEDQYVCDLYYDCGEGECVRANVQAHQTAEGAAQKHGEAADSQRTFAPSASGSSVQRLVLSWWGAFIADVPPIGWIIIAGLLVQAALVWAMLP